MSLYRFLSFENTCDTLKNMRLKLVSPKFFNDPFDCRCGVDDCDPDFINLPRNMRFGPGLCYNAYGPEKKRFNKFIDDAVSGEDIAEIEKWRIVCFSKQTEAPKNILMWSLYADEHRGCMIEFSDEFEFFLRKQYDFSDIVYKNERICIKFHDDDETVSQKRKEALLSKSLAWEHEKESRLIINEDVFKKGTDENLFRDLFHKNDGTSYEAEFMKIKKEFIKNVYVGARMNEEDMHKLTNICCNLTLRRLRLCAVRYELHDFDQNGCDMIL